MVPRTSAPSKSACYRPAPAVPRSTPICAAVRDAQAGRVHAVATAPVNKLAFSRAGLPWKGHTDLLAHLTGSPTVAMMFWSRAAQGGAGDDSRAACRGAAPRHPRDAGGHHRTDRRASCPRFGIPAPRLALAGLNPHAGEDGLLGSEEDGGAAAGREAAAESAGCTSTGPFPADTAFVRAARGEFDAVIACYHDQGLIPVKLLAFGQAVNVTLGLPIIRTSVDHGTAFDIAGRDVADPSSMITATLLAAQLARAR